MKVGIYNRWLATLGGGEKYSLSIAEHLSGRHQVTVLSHQEVPKELAAERLKLDLSGVDFGVLPEYAAEELEKVSAGFDLFFNASFMSYFPARAPVNILIVFFPSPVRWGFPQRFRRRVGFSLKQFFMIPSFETGLFRVQPRDHSRRFKTDVTTTLRLPGSRRPYSIMFRISAGHPGLRGVSCFLNNQLIESVALEAPGRSVPLKLPIPAGEKGVPLRLDLEAEKDGDAGDARINYLLLSDLDISHPRFKCLPRFFSKGNPDLLTRLYNIRLQPSSLAGIVGTYDQVWAISKFTEKWINTYWERKSEILYPPVEIKDFPPGEKRNRILNVGRFFAGGHNKKHLEMMEAFKAMVREGLTGWELHLAGGTKPEAEHQAYLKRICRQARDYPIFIHPDVSYPELTGLYGQSALYWHASGFREREDREPHKFEHFGITTVEAMAAGCVPVVIGKGGQPEIVQHGENGFLWQNLGELKKYTWELVRNEALRRRLSGRAMEDSRRFDRAHFNDTLDRLLAGDDHAGL